MKPATTVALPLEIYALIADVLFDSDAKKTLMELLCANRSVYTICIPSLMRSLELSERNGFNVERLGAFSRDAIGTGKFAFVKRLIIFAKDWGAARGSFVTIWNALVGLEILFCHDQDDDVPIASLAWSLLLKNQRLPIVKITFIPKTMKFVHLDIDHGLELPGTIGDVEIQLTTGTASQPERLHLLRLIDNLPKLEHFGLRLNGTELDRELFTFPKLLRCLEPRSSFLLSDFDSLKQIASKAALRFDFCYLGLRRERKSNDGQA